MAGCRLGAMESWKTRYERCVLKVKKSNRSKAKKARVNPWSICNRSVPKYAGKQRRRVKSGEPGYKALVARGAPACKPTKVRMGASRPKAKRR